jgi:glucosamine-6-phosphate deaminase
VKNNKIKKIFVLSSFSANLFILYISIKMKTNLTSQISLKNISAKYYRPENAFEKSVLTRFEKVPTDIYESVEEGTQQVALEIAQTIRNKQKEGRFCVLALPGGNSPRSLYAELVRMHEKESLSFSNVVVFNMYEYYPLAADAVNSNLNFLKDALLDHVDIDMQNVFSPKGTIPQNDIFEFCRLYEQRIESFGGIDIAVLGIGRVGNIAFNEPGSRINSSTRLILLDNDSRNEATKIFGKLENTPVSSITMGIHTIMSAKKVVLLAWGEEKSEMIKSCVEGEMSDQIPASYLQAHNNSHVVLDLSAANDLTRIRRPWLVTSCDWNDKLIRSAIVWLCQLTKKPILKLTNRDYNENGLSELLALFGSAYNVNIKIFNDLQHTITGWPGGKPNADDTYRPERAKPFPKRIIVFSPHPDDDVISMGGTIRRLVQQGHEVHLAYETSGNIAVGDEEVIRYLHFLNGFNQIFNKNEDKTIIDKYKDIRKFLSNKKDGDIDTRDILTIKGLIRRGEARTACAYNKIPLEHVHFLDLPFYETGRIQKNPMGEKDVDIILKLLQEVQPQEIFVAGDLADPHGTHKVCTNAVLAAIDMEKEAGAEWLKNCRIWMYRGAWAEWEIEDIEMAVPISPEELRAKRNSILKHQSQMESAPFLGNDERLFWQRSEDRNRHTAGIYDDLGLASYEAMEAFVQYIPL